MKKKKLANFSLSSVLLVCRYFTSVGTRYYIDIHRQKPNTKAIALIFSFIIIFFSATTTLYFEVTVDSKRFLMHFNVYRIGRSIMYKKPIRTSMVSYKIRSNVMERWLTMFRGFCYKFIHTSCICTLVYARYVQHHRKVFTLIYTCLWRFFFSPSTVIVGTVVRTFK